MKYKQAGTGHGVTKPDYSKTVIFPAADFSQPGHQLQTVTIPPNTKQRVHKHFKQTEAYYVLEGICSIFINTQEYTAHPGDAFIVEPGDTHFLWNKSGNIFKPAVFKINLPDDSDDTEWMV